MLWDLRGSVSRWYEKAKKMPRDQTVCHGDFHKGNLFANGAGVKSSVDVIVIDWAFTRAGHVAWELVYFLFSSIDNSRNASEATATPQLLHEEEMRLLAVYHADLMQVSPAAAGYTLEQLTPDVTMVGAQQLINWVSDQAKPERRVEDAMSHVALPTGSSLAFAGKPEIGPVSMIARAGQPVGCDRRKMGEVSTYGTSTSAEVLILNSNPPLAGWLAG